MKTILSMSVNLFVTRTGEDWSDEIDPERKDCIWLDSHEQIECIWKSETEEFRDWMHDKLDQHLALYPLVATSEEPVSYVQPWDGKILTYRAE